MTAERIREAYETRSLPAIGALLADDVIWGEPWSPQGCVGREDVLATFGALLASGATAEVVESRDGPRGVLCHLRVTWPDGSDRELDIFQVFTVAEGLVTEITGYPTYAIAERHLT